MLTMFKNRLSFGALFLVLLLISFRAHSASLTGLVKDSATHQLIPDVIISIEGTSVLTFSDVLGYYQFSGLQAGKIRLRITRLGYRTVVKEVELTESNSVNVAIELVASGIRLKEVTITQNRDIGHALVGINQVDKALRPTNSAQDLLRLVPGLFTAQHAGGGKAEQIFLRGFDSDHGTDFSIAIDGMPVNMVSHAHGQGYSDFHFVIPETVDRLEVSKGTYAAHLGNFATSGAGEFFTKNAVKSEARLEYGRFNTRRALAMVNLGDVKSLFPKQRSTAYFAAEYVYADAYFEQPQQFSRLNVFGKYTTLLGCRSLLALSASVFRSDWDASGQVPERAVREGLITRFGSIDQTEGGSTARTNVNLTLTTVLNESTTLKQQVYYSFYQFDLYSNFTFFLNDTVNGDGIRQTEHGRHLVGFNSRVEHSHTLLGRNGQATAGLGVRSDAGQISLYKQLRRIVLDTVADGRINEQNIFAWLDETVKLTEKLSLNAAVRADVFVFGYANNRADTASGRQTRSRISPKLNLYYTPSEFVQVYVHSGFGFHSNDSRSVVSGATGEALPRAFGYETGSTFKVGRRLLFNVALWGLELANELVFVGDEGVVEISGATRRLGTDLAVRWEVLPNLFADADLNYSHGRFTDLPKGENFIPLAPRITSTGGLTWKSETGLRAALRYRTVDTRPANEANTVAAQGYFLIDAVAAYRFRHLELGFSIENLLNAEWNEAQFDTESRLRNETQAVSELHYTPGTPFFVKGSLAWRF